MPTTKALKQGATNGQCSLALVLIATCIFLQLGASGLAGEEKAEKRGPLDPRGKIHIPIGIANTVDTLKTFVEAEGVFSPGCASYGIYFWIYDPATGKLTAPTMDGVESQHGLNGVGHLIPWITWKAGDFSVREDVCHTFQTMPRIGLPGQPPSLHIVGTRVQIMNNSKDEKPLVLYAALRSLGPSGWPVKKLEVSADGSALLVDGHSALLAGTKPSLAGVLPTDTVGDLAMAGKMPDEKRAANEAGDCSGALRFDLKIPANQAATLGFICPVLAGRRAVGHQWDGKSKWAQFDEAVPNPENGGLPQPDPGLMFFKNLAAEQMFEKANDYWNDLSGRATLKLPDARWAECFAAITGHAALCMNEGAPDVAVVNYNVFNRDGVYVANILQKSAHPELAEQAIDYFIKHPFNGRVEPEADNPGQILWIMAQHWQFTQSKPWLKRIYPSAKKIAQMIQYYRTAPEPHWVNSKTLVFGEDLKPAARQQLKPGACDGFHPEYTEAFDLAGIRAAIQLAEASEAKEDVDAWKKLEETLAADYDKKYGEKLKNGYGSYSVLWPCHLYPYNEGKAYEQFKSIGAQKSASWRYFPLATAHQGLLAGNRAAGFATIENHLAEEQMRGWYAFDEGGKSGSGGWKHVKTTWNGDVAMPHGWAIAEMQLLLRDCLAFEDGKKLVLLSGVPVEWFKKPEGMSVAKLPTMFGPLTFVWKATDAGASLTLDPKCAPADGFVLRLPAELKAATVKAGGAELKRGDNGEVLIPAKTEAVQVEWAK
jgi:hypothetical protein